MKGKVDIILNCGTIVQVYLDNNPRPINFDHRPFTWMYEAEGPIVGRILEYDEETKTCKFLDQHKEADKHVQ